jgi:hypothetical protein
MSTVLDPEGLERETQTAELADIARYLQDQLGQQFTAYIAGIKDAKMVGKWISGTDPRPMPRMRLRHAYMAARMLVAAYGPETTEAWFFGSNTRLDDDAPAWVLRYSQSLDDLRFVVPAAKAFARTAE